MLFTKIMLVFLEILWHYIICSYKPTMQLFFLTINETKVTGGKTPKTAIRQC